MGIAEILLTVAFPLVLSLGAALAMTDATSGEFWFARACFLFSALDIAGLAVYWLWPEPDRFAYWRMALAAIVGAVALSVLLFSLNWVDQHEMRSSTRLYADSKPNPPFPANCQPSPDALMIFLGTSLAWTTRMPHTIIEVAGQELLSIDRFKSGISIKILRIFDDKKDIIARVENGDFWVSPNIRKIHTKHTLTVYDHNDDEVLNIDFLNEKAILITGTFRQPTLDIPVIVAPE
jgi:hypothetical protein